MLEGGVTAKSLQKIFRRSSSRRSSSRPKKVGTSESATSRSFVNIERKLDNIELFKTLIEDYQEIIQHIQEYPEYLPRMEMTFNIYIDGTTKALKERQDFIQSLGTHFDLPINRNYINQERIKRLTKDLHRIKERHPKEVQEVMETIINKKIEAIRLELEVPLAQAQAPSPPTTFQAQTKWERELEAGATTGESSTPTTQYVETIPTSPRPSDAYGGGGGAPWSWVGVMFGLTLLVLSISRLFRGDDTSPEISTKT